MAFCERKVSANWWFRANLKKNIFPYFAFIVIGLSLFSKILQKEKQLSRGLLLQELVVRLNYALLYDSSKLINSRMAPRALSRLSSLSFAKYWQGILHKKIKQQQKHIFQSVSIKLSTTSSRNHELRRASFHSTIFLFVCLFVSYVTTIR